LPWHDPRFAERLRTALLNLQQTEARAHRPNRWTVVVAATAHLSVWAAGRTDPNRTTPMPSDDLRVITVSPAAALLLTAMAMALALASLNALCWQPDWVERSMFRPHWWVRRTERGTLVSSAVLHAELTHLGFNGFTFWAFGFGLERSIGTPKSIALWLVGLLASDALIWLQQRSNAGYRTRGASGAISVVLFASIVYVPQASIFIPPMPIPAPRFALAYLACSIWVSKRAGGRVNHDAQIGGAVAGVVFVLRVDLQAAAAAWRWVTN
jgi:membrane associated rhomboid family serine protease